jgi:hypothetical protein
MKIRALIGFAAMAITLVHAQQPQQQEAARQQSKPTAFRFEYTLTELSGKQKINTRKFEIMTGNKGSLRSSSKIAVPVGSFGTGASGVNTQFTYVDLGLRAEMESVTMKPEGMISLWVEVDETFLVPSEPTSSGAIPPGPSTRQVVVRTATEVKPGVPTVLGIVEDVASTHSFELSVTATPL